RRDDAAERAGDAVASIVSHDQQNVRRALGRHDARRPVGLGVRGIALELPFKFLRQRRKLISGNRRRRAGRTRLARDLYAVATFLISGADQRRELARPNRVATERAERY